MLFLLSFVIKQFSLCSLQVFFLCFLKIPEVEKGSAEGSTEAEEDTFDPWGMKSKRNSLLPGTTTSSLPTQLPFEAK